MANHTKVSCAKCNNKTAFYPRGQFTGAFDHGSGNAHSGDERPPSCLQDARDGEDCPLSFLRHGFIHFIQCLFRGIGSLEHAKDAVI